MKVTQLEITRNLLTDLEKLNRSFADVNRQLSSHKKLNTLSDSPFGSASLVNITEQALRLDTYRFNVINSSFQLKTAESALNAVNNIFTSINVLGMQAANEPIPTDGRKAILNEIESLRDELIARGNTQVEGRYIFAGSLVNVAPFELDIIRNSAGEKTGETFSYNGNDNVHSIPIGDGVEVVAGVSGQKALGAVFDAVNDLIAALETAIANDNADGIGAALEAFGSALSELGAARGQIGASLSMVERMSAMIDTRDGVLREQRSNLEDANIYEVAIRLGQLQTAINAALSSGGAILQQNSLFDIIG